jgi:hypothetical protein
LGSFFKGAYLKIGPKDFYWDTIQPLSSARSFLLGWKYSRMVCMGRSYSAISSPILNNWKEQFENSQLSREMVQSFTCAGVILVYVLKIFILYTNDCNSIQWTSGNTRLVRWNRLEFESASSRSLIYLKAFFPFLNCPKDFHLFLSFYTAWFLLVKIHVNFLFL